MGLRGATLAFWAALLGLGLLVASPFLSRGLVGTGEAYNYSLAVADAVLQMRQGEIPPLAGQTEYAFNGRIHPLRNAPYLFYLAAAIDAATLHHLSFWELQNVSLTLSLIAAVVACYAGLRWATACSRLVAFLLAALYALSPPLLCAVHQLDLFMTVHAAVFVPLTVAACVRSCRQPSFSADAWLAAALAAAWLAHPPVAVWLTFGVLVVRTGQFLLQPSWATIGRATAAIGLFLGLASFVFASVASLNADLGYFKGNGALYRNFAAVVMRGIHSTFPAAVLPVTRSASATGDFQFGYVAWLITLASLALAIRRIRQRRDALPALLLSVAVVLLVLLVPVPGVTHVLWRLVPGSVLTLTTEWPMQRLYLVALSFGIFGAATTLPEWAAEVRPLKSVLSILVTLGSIWIVYQAGPFLALGYANRWSLESTEEAYQPSNLNLTVTSYAFLGLPPTYNHGVMDPSLEFRILQDGRDEISSNLSAAFANSPIIDRGSIVLGASTPGSALSKPILLQPGHRYLVTFAFKIPPASGIVTITGTAVHRFYGLPESGMSRGFGMLSGQRKTLPLWTDAKKPEAVVLGVAVNDPSVLSAGTAALAEFSLQDIELKSLPARLESLLPLRFSVDQPQTECTVETPRRYLSGYRATVNGIEVTPLMSPTRQLMIPIPAGRCEVEIRYQGPEFARVTFWLTAFTWIAFFVWRIFGSPLPADSRQRSARLAIRAGGFVWKFRWAFAAGVAGVAVFSFLQVRALQERRYLSAVGPMRIDFKLPYQQLGINQPLLTTGKAGAGVITFVDIIDGQHIRLCADVWGSLYQSKPLAIDFFKVQTVVVSDSALFPLNHPGVRTLRESDRDKLRGELRIELNGAPVIEEHCFAYESDLSEIQVGHTGIGSLTKADFLGEIVGFGRLPIPQTVTLPTSDRLALQVRFPKLPLGGSQPLLSLSCGSNALTCFVTGLERNRLRISTRTTDGTVEYSGPLDADTSVSHELAFQPEGTGERNHRFGLACYLDGNEVMGDAHPLKGGAPSTAITGLDVNATPGVAVRFLGAISEVRRLRDGTSSPDPLGPLHFVIRFPTGKLGRNEPLLTTGHTGEGDLLYVIYADAQHIRLGFDHWGGAGAITEPIAVDYSQPHEFTVRTGALYPGASGDPAWHGIDSGTQQRLKSEVEVVLDGKLALSAPVKTHPTTAEEITVIHNRIGMSTADQDFSGTLEFAERTGVSIAEEKGGR